MTTIVIRYFDGCPNIEMTKQRLTEALGAEGMQADVRLEEVTDPDHAERLGFPGSPTVLVDGHDAVDEGLPTAFACRRYGTEGAPTVDQLRAALKR